LGKEGFVVALRLANVDVKLSGLPGGVFSWQAVKVSSTVFSVTGGAHTHGLLPHFGQGGGQRAEWM
jgi:hypothetical protein